MVELRSKEGHKLTREASSKDNRHENMIRHPRSATALPSPLLPLLEMLDGLYPMYMVLVPISQWYQP